MNTPNLTFTRRDWLIAVIIILIAFAYRSVIIINRATAPNEISAFDPLPAGNDQAAYYGAIAAFREGTFPPSTYFFQPGMAWFMIAISALIRTDNLGALRLMVAALASINCGLMIAVTRLAFGKRSVGVLAGFLLAVYPVGTFYDTDFVITSQATILVTLMLFGCLWLWRSPRNWTGALLVGLATGIAAMMRFEIAAVGVALCSWLLWKRRDRLVVFQVGLAAALAAVVLLPFVLHNRAGGADYLITPVGAAEVYRGNNRDADGTYGGGLASGTTGDNYFYFLMQDVLLSPVRFVELELHKIGLFLSASEPGNNLNYAIAGQSVSAVLRWNPFDFRVLMALFAVGLIVAIQQQEPASLPLGLGFLTIMVMTLLIWVEARIRTPVIATMMPVAAYCIVYVLEHLPKRINRDPISRLTKSSLNGRRVLLPVVVILALISFSYLAETYLPLPVVASGLPADAQVANAVYDHTLRLAGWKVEEQYSPSGVVRPFEPYVVSLYWQLLEPTAIDYSFSLVYLVGDQRLYVFDHPIGVVAFPPSPTSLWQVGQIHVEQVSMAWREFDGPVERSGDLLLYVYPGRDINKVLAAEGIPDATNFVRLARPAIMIGSGRFTLLSPESLPQNVSFGTVLTLKGWSLAEQAHQGETIKVVLGWQTTGEQIHRFYSIGVYVFNSAGQFVAQADSPPHDGNLLTASLPTGYSFEDVKSVVMPSQPDTYTLYVGVYDLASMDRLAVKDAPSNLQKIGEVKVSGQ